MIRFGKGFMLAAAIASAAMFIPAFVVSGSDEMSGGVAYVVNRNGTVAAVNTATRAITGEVAVGVDPTTLAVGRDRRLLYVTNTRSNTISVISTDDLSVVAEVPTGNGPWGIAVTPDGHHAYVSHVFDGTVGVLRLSDNTFIETITSPFFDTPQGVAITPNGKLVYVANVAFLGQPGGSTGQTNLTAIQTADNTVIGIVDLSSLVTAFGPWDVTILPNGNKAYTSDGDDGEFVFEVSIRPTSPSFNQVTEVIPIGQTDDGVNGPRGMESGATPNGVRVYSALPESGEVVVIDPAKAEVEARIATGGFFPWRVRLNRSGTELYVSLRDSDEVLVVDTRTNQIVATIPGFSRPADIAFKP